MNVQPIKRIHFGQVAICLALAGTLAPWLATSRAQQKTEAGAAATQTERSSGPADDKAVMVNTDLVSFNVTVTDIHGRLVSGLTKSDFTVFDDKQQQDIVLFSDDDAPISVGIVYDLTDSLKGAKEKYAQVALSRSFENSGTSTRLVTSLLTSSQMAPGTTSR